MGVEPDYYAILGVAPNSEDVVIQAAYRALMRRYHPDTNRSEDAASRAQMINEAYAVLCDPARRAQYDRKFAAGERNSAPPPPPPPDSDASATDNGEPEARRIGNQKGLAAWGVYAAIVCVVAGIFFVISANSTSSAAEDNTMNVDDLAVDNLVVNDTTAFDAANMDMNATDTNMTMSAENSGQPSSLSQVQQPPVSYADIEGAADKFASLLMSSGMLGARKFSEDCHRRVAGAPTWSSADFCAAFDFAAAAFDTEVSKQGGFAADGYFRFQRDNQSDQYVAVGAMEFAANARIRQIQSASAQAVADSVGAALARNKKPATKPNADPFDDSAADSATSDSTRSD